MLIGKRVKQLRKDQNMSLTELSEKSGVQIATLSRIENLKMTGTIESHMSIAKAFNLDIAELYKGIDMVEPKAEKHTPKSPTDVFVHNDQSSYEILTNHVLSKKMMPMLLKIEPNGETNIEQTQKGAEKFVFVLDGTATIKVGEETFELSKNNTLYFDASLKHTIKNEDNTAAKVLVIGTPVAL